jgi:diguanylate cyclase (GGDEF)-like protein/PAS domain S-box-containing protein
MSTHDFLQIGIDDIPINVAVYRYVDGDFVFVDFNKRAEKTEHIKKEDVLGKCLTELFPSVKEFGLFDVLLRVHDNGGQEELDLEFYKDERISGWRHNSVSRLPNGDVITLYQDLTEHKSLEERNKQYEIQKQEQTDKAKLYKDALLQWAQVDYKDLDDAIKQATKILAVTLNIERSSVWLYAQNNTVLECASLYSLGDDTYSQEGRFDAYSYPRYFEALQGHVPLVIEDAQNDPMTSEFMDNYLVPLDIKSMLDIPIIQEGRVIGVVCNENTGEIKKWAVEDIEFSIAIATNVSLALEIERRKGIQAELEQSEEKFKVITDNTLMGIFIYHEKYVYANKALCELGGYTPEELYAMHPWEGVAEPYVEPVKKTVERRLKGEHFPDVHDDIQIIRKNGQTRTIRVMTHTIRYQGQYAGMGTVMDITDAQEAQEQLKLLAQAIEQMDEMVRITDKNGIITYVNDALLSHSGYTKEDLIGRKIGMFKSGFHHQSFYADLWDTIMSGKTFKAVFTNRKKDKKLFYEEEIITPIMDSDGNIQHFVATSQDITERVLMEEKLQKLATIDSLTGICNRYKINEEIEIEIGRNKRYDESFALAMLDIDHFKRVNDTFGHEVGDYVLQEVSKIVTKEIRESDRFGRWGGEEFMLILPKLSKKEALHVSEKLRSKIESYDFKDAGHITISIGVTVFEPSDSKENLLKRADNALYKAKDEGRNRVVFD